MRWPVSLGYLLASLPMLFPDRAPAIGTEAFVEACAAALGPCEAEAAALWATGGEAPSAHPAVKAWRALEAAVAVAIGRERREEITATFGELERIWDEYEVYEKVDV